MVTYESEYAALEQKCRAQAKQIAALEQRVKKLEAERDNLKADAQKILESRAKVSLEIIDLRAENDRLQARLKEQADAYSELIAQLHRDVAERDREIERLRGALESIAANTCCDKCQEAALVAKRALGGGE